MYQIKGMRLRINNILQDYTELEYIDKEDFTISNKGIIAEVGDNAGYFMNIFILTDFPREINDLFDSEIVFWDGYTVNGKIKKL